ncbi:MAG: serpin family protein [Planctomycetota bacterium]|jgi:serpin B
MTLSFRHIVLIGLTVSLAGILGQSCLFVPEPQFGELVKSDVARELQPELREGQLAELVWGNNNFGLDLYQAISAGNNNLLCSPYSISLTLAMTYSGARAETARQIKEALHFNLPEDELHEAFNALDQLLSSRGQGARAADGGPFRLNICNALWYQKDYPYVQSFLDVLALNYGAGLQLLDFSNDPQGSTQTINDWVSHETEGRIQNAIDPGMINSYTRLVLANAVYFNAAWEHIFEESNTRDREFYLLDDTQIMVPMMQQKADFGYSQGEGYQAVELPYDGQELSMVILLPDRGQFQTFETSLDIQLLNTILAKIYVTEVLLTMPKFTFVSEFDLKAILQAMGITDAYVPSLSDFSGIDGGYGDLHVSEMIHKTWVKVNEKGTEATAFTFVGFGVTSAPPQPIIVTIDRPFIFLIRDVQTGTILFVGRVVNPG